MNICMNEEICINVCASMDSQALWSCITYALQLSLIFYVPLLLPHLPDNVGAYFTGR